MSPRRRAAERPPEEPLVLDVIDASVVVCALEHGGPVLTSDPADLRRLAPDVRVVDVASLPR